MKRSKFILSILLLFYNYVAKPLSAQDTGGLATIARLVIGNDAAIGRQIAGISAVDKFLGWYLLHNSVMDAKEVRAVLVSPKVYLDGNPPEPGKLGPPLSRATLLRGYCWNCPLYRDSGGNAHNGRFCPFPELWQWQRNRQEGIPNLVQLSVHLKSCFSSMKTPWF